MRSAKIDECFNDPEEREFLQELVEQALGEAHETLEAHNNDAMQGIDLEISVEAAGRQRRRIKFLEDLYSYLE